MAIEYTEIPISGEVGIRHVRRDTYVAALIWEYNDTPIDMTGYSAYMQIRVNRDTTSTLLASVSTSGGGITLTALSGRLDIVISSTVMQAIAVGQYWYDVVVVSGAGVRTTLQRGPFYVVESVTDA